MQATSKPLLSGQPQGRLLSLDALRGFDMFWIVSGEGIFHGLAKGVMEKHHLVRNTENWQIIPAGNLGLWERIALGISNQLHHSVWDGFTFYDLIFPLFIFVAGVSMPYSMGRQLEAAGANRPQVKSSIYRSLIKRTLILILLGMVVNGALRLQGYENTRFASVLGRIAISCFLGAVIYLECSLRKQMMWFAGLLLAYWAAMMWIPVPGFGAGNLTPEGNLAAYIDRMLLPGKLYRTVYDPEGLLSNLPAAGSALLGIFAGQFLRMNHRYWTMARKSAVLVAAGLAMLLAGWAWNLAFPVNKALWTSSFVLVTGGWSAILLGLFYGVIDAGGLRRWCMPFVWLGTNSILIYMASHGVVNFESTSKFLFGGLINMTPELWHEAALWTGVAIIQFAALYYLYQKKIFLKV
jgi:predicted acyltransferase